MHTLSDSRNPNRGGPRPALPRAFVGSQGAYEQICAWGQAMGWDEKPFDFVVERWLASRRASDPASRLVMPR